MGEVVKPEAVKAWRAGKGLTQKAAAALVGVTMRTWQNWESGSTRVHPLIWETISKK